MALPAGRKGVLPSEITPEGKIKIPDIPSELPAYSASDVGKVLEVNEAGKLEFAEPSAELPSYSSSDAGKVLQVDSEGSLAFNVPPAGMKLYTKEFSANGNAQVSGDWYQYEHGNIGIAGYTPVFAVAIDVYQGYHATPGGICRESRSDGYYYYVTAFMRKANDNSAIKFLVFYVKNENIEALS